MNAQLGITISLGLEDGSHSGVRVAEITGWDGYAVAGPKSKLEILLRRDRVDLPGVYILAGLDRSSRQLAVCIEQCYSVAKCIPFNHSNFEREFWTQIYCITCTDSKFDKATALHVKSELIARVRRAGHALILDSGASEESSLSKDAIFQAEDFLQKIELVLPTLGLDIFQQRQRSRGFEDNSYPNSLNPIPSVGDKHDYSETWSKSEELDEAESNYPAVWGFMGARARIHGKETTVMAGSPVTYWNGTDADGYAALQHSLADNGTIRWTTETSGVLTRDVEFKSPSAAASVIIGRSADGRISWKRLNETESVSNNTKRPTQVDSESQNWPVFTMNMPSVGIRAKARLNVDGKGMTLLKGSVVRGIWVAKTEIGPYRKTIRRLVRNETILHGVNGLGTLQADVQFSSPSAAAAIVAGTGRNGLTSWKHQETGETLGIWLRRRPTHPDHDSPSVMPGISFVMSMPTIGIKATARLSSNMREMTVLRGSIVRGSWASTSLRGSTAKFIRKLVRNGTILRGIDDLGRLQVDVRCSSPSSAASLVAGTNRSGLDAWIHKETREPLGRWIERSLGQSTPSPPVIGSKPLFVMKMPSVGLVATARLNSDSRGMMVLKGSIVRGAWDGKMDGGPYRQAINELIRNKTIIPRGDGLGRLQANIRCKSPSAAAAIVAGTVRSGPSSWVHHETGETLGSWLRRRRT